MRGDIFGRDLFVLGLIGSVHIGVHGGLTLRVAGKTDISIGYAHFLQEVVRLQVNDSIPASRYRPTYRTPL